MHCFIDRASVWEGCYVRVDKFRLAWFDVPVEEGRKGGAEVVVDGVGDPEVLERERERTRKEKGGRRMRRVVYLVVEDLVTVGWNEGYAEILKRERESQAQEGRKVLEKGERGLVDGGPEGGEGEGEDGDEDDDEEDDDIIQHLIAVEASAATKEEVSKTPPPETPVPDEPDDIIDSDSDSAFESLVVAAAKVEQRRIAISSPTPAPDPDPRQELKAAIINQNRQQNQGPNQSTSSNNNNPRPPPWMPINPLQPLKLTPLVSIPHLPYRQNWMVNVLAVVTSLGPVEPSHIAPSFRQRTARLADMSTAKRVHLSVFLDPEDFTPEVGRVLLLLGVKNHLFDGGSLRKYVSDRPRNGTTKWWIQRPESLGWCRAEVERLRGWWEGNMMMMMEGGGGG
jgi:hypothetical protein